MPVGRRTPRAPPPPRRLSCPSSVPVGRRTSPAPHHGCDEGLRTAQLRRSSARAEATSGAVAHASASRSPCQRDQPSRRPPTWVRPKNNTKLSSGQPSGRRSASLSQTPGGGGGGFLWFHDRVCLCQTRRTTAPNEGANRLRHCPCGQGPPAPVLMTGAQKLLCSSSREEV